MWWGKPKYSSEDIILLKEHIRKKLLGRSITDTVATLGAILGDRPPRPLPDGKEVLRRIKQHIKTQNQRGKLIGGIRMYIPGGSDIPAHMLQLMYEKKLEEMPEFLGGQHPFAQVIASWRLEIGK